MILILPTVNALSTRKLSRCTLSDRLFFRSSTKNGTGVALSVGVVVASGMMREYGKPLWNR